MKNTLAHTLWECKYHIVWIPKKRRKVLYGKLQHEIRTILKRLCEYKKVEIVEGKLCEDHVHLCLSIPPKYSVSDIVGYLKGRSAIIIFEKYSGMGRNFKGQSFWARGYSVGTVGKDEKVIREYIRSQESREEEEENTVKVGNYRWKI
ncbi:MAG: IS200/IS605 family transposase [FCB group bacterium]|nr:IS200/IS605 family transposase [FCB group bacterium]